MGSTPISLSILPGGAEAKRSEIGSQKPDVSGPLSTAKNLRDFSIVFQLRVVTGTPEQKGKG
jgi:hypothetical protein